MKQIETAHFVLITADVACVDEVFRISCRNFQAKASRIVLNFLSLTEGEF